MSATSLFRFVLLSTVASVAAHAQVYFAPDPGPARAEVATTSFRVGNGVIEATWQVRNGAISGAELHDLISHRTIPAPPAPFVLLMKDGRVISPADLHPSKSPVAANISAQLSAAAASQRVAGKQITFEADDPQTGLHAIWRAIILDGANYFRQEITLSATRSAIAIAEVRLVDWNLPDAQVVGAVKGSPVVAGTIFTGFEHPLSGCAVGGGRARCALDRALPLQPGAPVTYSSVIGVAPAGQLRRAFLYYL
ncbi:MAG TPA: hypothetical protein VKB56_06665, partial [Terriglobales bacterium]|nr:hypothetical protein [Terriglobales bacterium]